MEMEMEICDEQQRRSASLKNSSEKHKAVVYPSFNVFYSLLLSAQDVQETSRVLRVDIG